MTATVLWLPLRAFTFLVRSGPPVAAQSPLGDTALLLLLVLLHHAPPSELGPPNPFHSGLQHMQVRTPGLGVLRRPLKTHFPCEHVSTRGQHIQLSGDVSGPLKTHSPQTCARQMSTDTLWCSSKPSQSLPSAPWFTRTSWTRVCNTSFTTHQKP
jgi:hypothetical protein